MSKIPKDEWKCQKCEETFKVERPNRPTICPNPNCDNSKHFDSLSGPWQYFDGKRFVPMWLAKDIMNDYFFVTHEQSEELFIYDEGIYEPKGEAVVKAETQKKLCDLTKNNYVNETLEIIRRGNFVPPDSFGNPRELLAVDNGLLDLKKRELKEFSPETIHLTKITPEYDPDAECPKAKKFIKEIVREDDLKLVQEMFGYCLLKDYPLAKAFMLIGSGANGKSTLLNLLEIFLGEDNVAGPSLQSLLENRFAKIKLFGRLANIHADLASKPLEETGTFKMLTGGDSIWGEKKYQDAIKFKNYAKLIFSANELPRTSDRSNAFFRRWIIVDFPYQFPENDPDTDPNILDKIVTDEELSGLLNFALDGLDRVLKDQRFSRTEGRKDIEKKWIMQTDSLRAFVDQAVERNPKVHISKDGFYKVYRNFCEEHDLYIVKKGPVTKRIPTLIPWTDIVRPGKREEERYRCWEEVTLREDFIKNMRDPSILQNVKARVRRVQGKSCNPITLAEKFSVYEKGTPKRLDMLDTSYKGDGHDCEDCKKNFGIEKEALKKVRMGGGEKWLCGSCLQAAGYEVDDDE